jgi:signal peptidase II
MHRVQDRRTVTPLDRRASAAIILGVAGAAVAIDQIVKTIVENRLDDGHTVELAFGARFVLTYNSGAAFSVGAGRSGVFTVLASVTITGLLVYALWLRQRPLQALSFGLILGGAAGNLTDRLLRDNDGRVIDFIEVASWWPVFNVADISLFCGVAVLLVLSLRDESRRT